VLNIPIPVQLRFVGTGKPVRVNVNPRVERDTSRNGVKFSGIKTKRELNDVTKASKPNVQELGNKAVNIPRSSGIDLSA